MAGNAAERRIIGFSENDRWFAFEQFGIPDGSGGAYHEIFVIDLEKDKWAKGTPVRVFLKDENATPLQARNKARARAAKVLAKLKIVDQGQIRASNPVTEVGVSAHVVEFQRHLNLTGESSRVRIEMEEFPLPGEPNCKDLGVNTVGFALRVSTAGGEAEEFYHDTKLPKSRGCTMRYAIADVIAPQSGRDLTRYVVLVHVYSFGFEGPDTRFIAIPMTIPPR